MQLKLKFVLTEGLAGSFSLFVAHSRSEQFSSVHVSRASRDTRFSVFRAAGCNTRPAQLAALKAKYIAERGIYTRKPTARKRPDVQLNGCHI